MCTVGSEVIQIILKVSFLCTLVLDSDDFRASGVGEVRRVKAEFSQGFILLVCLLGVCFVSAYRSALLSFSVGEPMLLQRTKP